MNRPLTNNFFENYISYLARNKERWTRKYSKIGSEIGYLWGTEPSETARLAFQVSGTANSLRGAAGLNGDSSLVEEEYVADIGAGYGRDIPIFANSGYVVHAYDLAENAEENALPIVRDYIYSGRVEYIQEDFIRAVREKCSTPGKYSIISTHRTFHLMTDQQIVDDFTNAVAYGAADNAWIAIGVRDRQGFKKDQMEWIDETAGIARYKERTGHVIRYWTEDSLRHQFSERSKDFKIVSVLQGEEMESIENPGVKSPYTIILMQRKPRAEVDSFPDIIL